MSSLDRRASEATVRAPVSAHVPYDAQTLLDFACGPSSLMIVMKALDPAMEMSRGFEMQLWREARARGNPVSFGRFGTEAPERRFRGGWLPIVLVSSLYLHGDHVPHWVVVTGFDPAAVAINDPWADAKGGKSLADLTDRRIPRREFDGMARYGKAKDPAAVLVRRPPAA